MIVSAPINRFLSVHNLGNSYEKKYIQHNEYTKQIGKIRQI